MSCNVQGLSVGMMAFTGVIGLLVNDSLDKVQQLVPGLPGGVTLDSE